MRGRRAELFLHLVWATWDRMPLLTPEAQQTVYACIQAECRKAGGEVIAVGGTADHVHVLVRTSPTLSVAGLAKQLKGASSHLATHAATPLEFFKWQGGYGAFTVSRWDRARVARYVRRQQQHHAAGTLSRWLEPPAHP